MNKTDFNLDGLVGWDKIVFLLENDIETFGRFFERNFSLADLDISARVLQNWYQHDLLPNAEIKSRRHRFNFVELIYLYMVQDLRTFGYSLENIKKVKSSLFLEFDIITIIDSYLSPDVSNENDSQVSRKESIKSIKESLMTIPEENRQISQFGFLVLFAILFKMEVAFVLLKSGEVLPVTSAPTFDTSQSLYADQPRIILPLYHYLGMFLSREKYQAVVSKFKLINERELYLLEQVRKGKYSSIQIKMLKGEIIILEMTRQKKIDHNARLQEILLKGGYQSIEIKTQDGIISYSTVTDKKKFT